MTTDEGVIEGILRQLEIAWNAQDSVSSAAPFVEDVNFIQIFGGQIDGRASVEASHRHIFDTIYKDSRAKFTLRNIRFLRPDVAITFTRAHVTYYEGNETREMDARPTFILVKEQEEWRIVAFQNTRISEMPSAAEAASRLTS